MRKTFVLTILLTVIGASAPLSAQGIEEEVDLKKLYQQIDEAIENAPQYVAKRERQIEDTRTKFLSESSPEKKFPLAEQLFKLYTPYHNDSALYYADQCIALAESLQREDMVGLYLSQKAHQCSNTGLYVEALDLLKRIDKQALGQEGLTWYYTAWMHVCGEVGYYSQELELRNSFYGLQDHYRDSVLMVAEEGSEEFLHLKMDVLSARKLYQEALDISDKWLSQVVDGTHESAYAAFYRSMVFDKLNNNRQVRYWLGKSALDDIESAVYDQASLLMLAERLCEDGDYDRAYRYTRFSRECNTAFSPQLRNYQVRYAVNVLEDVYQDSEARYSRLLTIACAGALLLLGIIVWLLIRLRRK